MSNYPRVSKLKTADDFRQHVESLGIELPFDEELQTGPDSPLAQSIESTAGTIGNRFSILPMEGWDGTTDGQPTDLTRRRWKNFGLSGAKLIWGGEAVAVQPEGRANPNQLMINDSTLGGLEELRTILVDAHQDSFGSTDDLVVGLQLTHSGRFARPNRKDLLEPRTAYRHPVLDKRFNVDPDSAILSDDELKKLIDDFIASAKLAAKIGFQFVDVKHCHGYLGHELLSGFDRAGEFGGSFENRTKFLRDIVAGIRAEAPSLQIGIRLSVFDYSPFEPGPDGTGVPSASGDYPYAFGGDGTPEGMNLTEPMDFLKLLQKLNIDLLCTTVGSPYYNPHIQRPAIFPPSDGYQPPEDPLVGVARQIDAVAKLKAQFPDLIMISSGLSYLQEWLPNVGQYLVRNGMTDSLGLGRMVLSYPELPADALAGNVMQRKKVCRTFSDCTTAPRNGIISGCYPLDPFYKKMPEHDQLKEIKKAK
jgi:2,4-dienoyl-CoA reductase-like NADH-dependent reductase (Old Yellow Enzyme family)